MKKADKILSQLGLLYKGNINLIHLAILKKGINGGTPFKDWVSISREITSLYKLGESEKEFEIRQKHGILDSEYSNYANWESTFFVYDRVAPADSKIEHEYFLDLLYSISFTMYLISKEYTYFQNTLRYEIYQVDKHLAAYEHFLSLSNNLFISLDISIILIYLLSGVLGKRGVKGIQFNNKSIKLLKQRLGSQYFNLDESVLSENIKLLKTIRNNRAHRPHINWDRGKIVSSQKDLNKVRSVCERESLFNQDIFTFIEQSISESSNIVLQILKSSRNIYEARLNKTITITQPHKDWHEFLS